MKNVTITVDDNVLKRARIRALEHGTSVNKVLGEYLRAYAGFGQSARAVAAAIEIADRSHAGSGGRRWTRDELYDR